MALIDQIRAFARRYALWRPDTRVLVALSGGADSVALLHVLRDLAAAGDLVLAGAAHLNHQIRGADADGDEEFCRSLCAALGTAFDCERIDVPALARARSLSLEVTARQARLQFLERVRAERGADVVATAHTRDDQAETVLLRAIRGAGLRGLGGIRPARDRLIRPLLECGRDDLRAYLGAIGQRWREDATNADLANPRNRVRHDVQPRLARDFNPAVNAGLARLATLAAADDDFLVAHASDAFEAVAYRTPSGLELDADALAALPDALARRVVLRALETARPGRSYRFEEVEAVRAVAAGLRAAVQLHRVRVERFGARVVLMKEGQRVTPRPFTFPLLVPGEVEATDLGWSIQALAPTAVPSTLSSSGTEVTIEANALGRSLVVRNRQPGDAFRPLGLTGTKKLQDVFVDRKLRRDERDRWPVVADENGRIIWVPEHALAHDFRVTSHTEAVVTLKFRRVI